LLLVGAAVPVVATAQNRDSTQRSDSARLDDSDTPRRLTYGVTGGAMHFADGREQQSMGAVVRWHLFPSIAVATTPAFARVNQPLVVGGGTTTGMTDLPVELNFDHQFAAGVPLAAGLSFAMSLPVGDSATSFGSGRVGYSISGGLSASPAERLSLYFGAGRPLSNFSLQSSFGGAATTWGDAEASYRFTDRLGLSVGFGGDLTNGDSLGPSRAINGGLSIAMIGPMTLTINGSHGVSGASARWSTAIGVGTDFAWLGSVGSTSALQRVTNALAGWSPSGSNRGNSGNTPAATHGQGQGSGKKP